MVDKSKTIVTPKPAEAPVAVPVVAEVSLDELKKQLGAAIASGNDAEFNRIVTIIAKRKSELAKLAAVASLKEAEALAGVRETLAKAIHATVKNLHLDEQLNKVKALGFTYKLDAPGADGAMVSFKAVALLVPTIKVSKGGISGGGKSKAEYGKSLNQIFEENATDADRVKMAAAGDNNSKQWQVKVAVKKAALAAGKLQPIK